MVGWTTVLYLLMVGLCLCIKGDSNKGEPSNPEQLPILRNLCEVYCLCKQNYAHVLGKDLVLLMGGPFWNLRQYAGQSSVLAM